MKTHWINEKFLYDGSQLHSLFAYERLGTHGDSIVSWVGPCKVTLEHMVDGEDRRAGEQICGDLMLHFIVEKFDCSLLAAVALQRLLSAQGLDVLCNLSKDKNLKHELRREGDDLWRNDKKLSISIATVSPVSALIHFAVNVVNDGTPVPTLCLKDLAIEPQLFAQALMKSFSEEIEQIIFATQKVRWVK
jgi:uncharacterized protein